nr:immunoglobulin heavy chain junction region [Macaca mulatta]MOV56873.1 immunoglobulin heavy chain junction region [Macaca mulatta]MOV58325.1 immunoglobulin heavy chain junction region [Macaca mulatta]MOV58687.1 immunoglobulin heavy chain junction region [Macaca mulatta]MOV58953.1 immunoglobulin heavy chain junction region [Macaca mulatta]
CEVGAHW